MTAFTIYLWQLVDNLLVFFIVFGIVCSVVSVIASAVTADTKNQFHKTKYFKYLVGAGLTSFILAVLTPKSSTVAMMFVLPKIIESEVIQKDVPEVYKMAMDRLKGAITGTPEKPEK